MHLVGAKLPVQPVLAEIVQNEPREAKLALKTLGSIWLSSFYSVEGYFLVLLSEWFQEEPFLDFDYANSKLWG